MNNNKMDDSKVSERFMEIIEFLKASYKEVADTCGVSQQRVSAIMRGKEKVSAKMLLRFITAYKEVNPEYLLFGQGKIENKIFEDNSGYVEIMEKRIADLEYMMELLKDRIELYKGMLEKDHSFRDASPEDRIKALEHIEDVLIAKKDKR